MNNERIDTVTLFNQLKKYSKDNYIDTQEKYDSLFNYYNSKKLEELIIIFNSFELFSFDNEDYSDEALLILQILSINKVGELKLIMKKKYCDLCGKQSISKYRQATSEFVCDYCSRVLNGDIPCENCHCFPIKNERMQNDFCCHKFYCKKCLIDRVNKEYKEKKDKNTKEIITCYCGQEMCEYLVEVLVGTNSFKKNFKKFYLGK